MHQSLIVRRTSQAGLVATFLLATATAEVQAAPPAHAPGLANFPDISLPARAQGQAAIDAVGTRLPDLAAAYEMHPSEFAQMLRDDRSAWLDRSGRLYFVEEQVEYAEGDATDTLADAQYPLSQTFLLHSKPGAKRVIYLDFDGHTTSGTAWNVGNAASIVSPPYDTNNEPAFSDTELANIQTMWRQVAEDFAPFDVNVTTEDPGEAAIVRSSSGDEFYGTRAVITQDNFENCGCGGFAYVGVFDNVGSYYKPAFVFNTSVVGAGEAITHEVGHNLGLSHDGLTDGTGYYTGQGSGATGWAPIMGVGYYQKLVQWSKGEYANANNTQDDIQVIQNNGALLVVDDHGDSRTSATALDATLAGDQSELSGGGTIQSSNDVDVFSFVAAAGSYTLAIDPVPVSPNLDISLALRDSSGTEIATANPTESLPASLSGSLTGGEYYLYVEGTGKGSPTSTGYTDYGSLGRYAVTGTVAEGGGLSGPTAVANANYVPGAAPLGVSFDGSDSSDPDGTVETFAWDFGDGATGLGATPSHTYSQSGTFVATLTVTDNDGLTANDTAQVTVTNTAPSARALADVVSGQAPLAVNFSGDSSSDADGSISSAGWTFGDGATASGLNSSHVYTSAGSFTATLTVTDNLGESSNDSVSIDVSAPAFVDSYVSSEEPSAGSLGGSINNLQANDAAVRSVTERESGGRKRSRYSYLSHTWVITAPGGDSVTLYLGGYRSVSSDGDGMALSYSIDGGTFAALPINLGTNDADYLYALPASGGTVRVRVSDTDQTAGNRSLDTVYIDQLFVRTENGGGGPATEPAAASDAEATAQSSNTIRVAWTDNASDENGFRVDRSLDGVNFSEATRVGSNQISVDDSGLNADTTYYYRVVAFNGGGDALPSNVTSARTDLAPAVTLQSNSYKRKGVKTVELSWTGPAGGNLYRNGSLVGAMSGNDYTETLGKGGGTYTYQICSGDLGSDCSNTSTVVF